MSGRRASSTADPSKVILGRKGTYLLLERIGRGGYGTVYKGILKEEGKHVAVKRVSKNKLHPDERQALETEINLFKNLHDDHIVNYIEAIDDGARSGYLDIVMEYVEGGSLEKLVKEVQRGSSVANSIVLEEDLVAKFTAQILRGLLYLHQQGVVHRDIKGANILITKDTQVKLTDFGVSSETRVSDGQNQAEDATIDVVGTPYWMAPEIISLSGSGTASDIWSLGCTIIELLTGNPPFHELNEMSAMFRIVSDKGPPLPEGISPELEDFLGKCFDKDMNTRINAEDALRHRWILKHNEAVVPRPRTEPGSGSELAVKRGKSQSLAELNTEQLTLNAFAEEEENYDDLVFDVEVPTTAPAAVGAEPQDADPWSSPAEDDVFASMSSDVNDSANAAPHTAEIDFEFFDEQAEEERERIRRMKEKWTLLKRQMEHLSTSGTRVTASQNLVKILSENPEQKYNMMRDPGLLPLVEVLEAEESDEGTEAALLVALELIKDESDMTTNGASVSRMHSDLLGYSKGTNIQRDLCLSGMLPVVIRYAASRYSLGVRRAVAQILKMIVEEDTTIHMLIACKGFLAFRDLVEADLDTFGELTPIGIEGIMNCLNVDNQRYRHDFCRRLTKIGLLDQIVAGMKWYHETPNKPLYEQNITALVGLLQVLAERSDSVIKTSVGSREVLEPCLAIMQEVPAAALELMTTALRDLSRDPSTHQPILRAGGISEMVRTLGLPTVSGTVRKDVVGAIYNLCVVSPQNQEAAAVAGVIPYLQSYIQSNVNYLKNMSIEIYSRLGATSNRTRNELWEHSGMQFYLNLIAQSNGARWLQIKMLNSMVEWLGEDQSRVEPVLLEPANVTILETLVTDWPLANIEQLVEPYFLAISASDQLNSALGKTRATLYLVQWLKNPLVRKPRVRLMILRILLAHSRFNRDQVLTASGADVQSVLFSIVVQDEAIIVQRQAQELLRSLGLQTGETLSAVSSEEPGQDSSG